MSKRWFDLIAAIIFVAFFIATASGLNDGIFEHFVLNAQLLSIYIGYIIFVFVLLRLYLFQEVSQAIEHNLNVLYV